MADGRTSGGRLKARDSFAAIGALVLGVLSVVFSESLIIAAVVAFGPLGGFAVLFFGLGAMSVFIAFAFDAEETHRGVSPLVGKTRAWIESRRTAAEAKAARLAHLSESLAFVVLSVTVGPFVTTIALKVRGGATPRQGYLLALLSSAIFSAVWVAIYSGGLTVLRTVSGI